MIKRMNDYEYNREWILYFKIFDSCSILINEKEPCLLQILPIRCLIYIMYCNHQSFKVGVINITVWMMKINKVKKSLLFCPRDV